MDPQILMPAPATAPSSPNMFSGNLFYSAPTSPTHSFFRHPSPINSDQPQILHKNHEEENDFHFDMDMDFAFDFSGQLERPSISDADELFHAGKIKPLDPPPPRFRSSDHPPRSPESSPRNYNKKNVDNFSETFRRTPGDQTQNPPPRGRERTTSTRQKASRSLSPLRVSDILPDDDAGNNHKKVTTTNQAFPFGFMWYNKWNLKNLLLFRSTSEGSAITSAMVTKGDQDLKNSSFRSNDGGGGSVGGSSRRMKRKVSAHEIHYKANRAVAEEMRKKTLLPYKSGLLGCLGLGFHHNLHEISRGR